VFAGELGTLESGVLRLYRHVLQRGGRRAPTPLPHHAMDLGPHSITTSLSSPSACSMGPTVVRYGMSPESVTPAATPTVCLLALLLQDIREHFSVLRTPRKRLSYVATREDFGRMIFQKNSSWVSYLFKVMSDGIGKTRRRQLRCRKWISILEQQCSYTPATEAVLPSIHYATSVISRSGAALRRYFFCFCLLRWGWVFLERTWILSGIQFTTHFIEILVVETKRFVGSFVHVILMRQTCGQRSSRAAESKRRALGNYFSERICYMFLISKCRGD